MKLYKMNASPPARAAMMLLDMYQLPVEMIDLNPEKKEQFKPEFLEKNPLHTVPCLEDGDVILQDSHAILMYLADKYGKDESLYPKDVVKRAHVNQKLFFDTGVLFLRLRTIVVAIFYDGAKELTERNKKDVIEAYGFMEIFLSKSKYLAAEHMTIADISAITYVTTIAYIIPIESERYPKLQGWIHDMELKPFCKKYNAPGGKIIGDMVKAILASRNKNNTEE